MKNTTKPNRWAMNLAYYIDKNGMRGISLGADLALRSALQNVLGDKSRWLTPKNWTTTIDKSHGTLLESTTHWYPAVISPARAGVYEIFNPGVSDLHWAYWTGRAWNRPTALRSRATHGEHSPFMDRWRGLTGDFS